ncbi:MAG: exo-alpha-sialidase [Gemmatimonadales bacterium]|nr:MAG: exo-alpha-sialidase [Gemmatimonadales bacterium]
MGVGTVRPAGRLTAGVAVALTVAGCSGDARPPADAGDPRVELLGVPGEATQSADPSLAVDPVTGDLLLAWGAADGAGEDASWNLYMARSGDGGATFSAPVRVNDVDGDLYPHAEGAPRLVAGPGGVAVFWNNRIVAEGRRFAASDLRFSRSTDGGATWSAARNLQDPLSPATLPPRGNTFHGATWLGDSTLVVAWLDGRERDARRIERGVATGLDAEVAARTPEAFADNDDLHDGDAAVYAAVSQDGGASWESGNRRIDGGICPCCRVALTQGANGEILGGWRQHLGGNVRDPVVATVFPEAAASAAAEGAPARIHDDGWVFPGCPHSGPALDVDVAGTVHAAWYTGAEGRMGVYFARRARGEAGFGAPVAVVAGASVGIAHPAVVARDNGHTIVAYNVDAEGRRHILLGVIDEEGSVAFQVEVPDSEGGTHPQLALLPDGGIVVAWTESRSGLQRLRLARLDG